jgi:HD-GYP domain-containing protein (c-di-GMP phosphodiesterase class II)
VSPELWKPVSIDQLRVGHFVRLGHRWFEHPFLLNRFRISSDSEIAIMRDARLTKVYIDPARSATTPVNGAPLPDLPEVPTLYPQPAGNSIAEQLQTLKAAHAQRVRDQHEQIARTRLQYSAAVDDCSGALSLLARGAGEAYAAAGSVARQLVSIAASHDNPLAFAEIAQPVEPAQLRACQALDAAAIAAAVGRRLALKPHGMTTLTLGAMLHAAGIEQLPSNLQEESALTVRGDLLDFQQYPMLGADQLRRCGQFPIEVLQIVQQHRERLDGTGFPERTAGDAIHPFARIVGAIREFQVLSMRHTSSLPAAALTQLYRRLRGAYGPTAIDNVIAALTVYPPGSFLALSDGSIGRVVQVSDRARLRPTVCLFDESVDPQQAQIVDLADTEGVSVAQVLDPDLLATEVRRFFGAGWSGMAFSHQPAQAA